MNAIRTEGACAQKHRSTITHHRNKQQLCQGVDPTEEELTFVMKMAGLTDFGFVIVKTIVHAVELKGTLWVLKGRLRDLPYMHINGSSYVIKMFVQIFADRYYFDYQHI